MHTLRTFRTFTSYFTSIVANRDSSTFFPSVETEDEAAVEKQTSTEPSEILSQLPDAPTEEPEDVDDTPEPSSKKQKTDEADDDFVVVEKEDAKEDTPKPEL